MRRLFLSIFLCIILMSTATQSQSAAGNTRSFDCSTITDVTQEECECLVALYESTNGSDWINQDNWLMTTTVGNWYGVNIATGHVTSLELNDNNLVGQIPTEFTNLNNLTFLRLDDNQLSGNIPESMGNLSNLQYIELETNQLDGSIPDSLGNLNNLTDLYLHENQLSGSIPESLGNLINLDRLYLSENQLTGNIPDSLGDLSNLKYLWLFSNQLSGNIPASLGNLNNLNWLFLDDNLLSGSIPESLGNLSNLKGLYLRENQLSGNIPASLGNLTNLQSLRLNNNLLLGDVPDSFTNLVNLCVPGEGNCTYYGLDLGYNYLNVPAPEPLASFLAFKDPDWHLTQQMTTFNDVSVIHWAYDWIERLYDAGVTSGCSQSPPLYCPEQSVTRAEMAKFLLKGVHGGSYTAPPVGTSTGFDDVPTDYWAADWITQLALEGITSGCGGGNYCPNNQVTRAEMAKFLLTAKHDAGYTPPPVNGGTGFSDVPDTYWAAAWIKQLAEEGITSGCGGGNYCPDDDVTRAEMAKFLVLTFNLP